MTENKKLYNCIFMILLALFFITFCIVNFVGFARFCDSDMYQDVYAARLFWEKKSIFPDGWTFGNQYYVLATPAVASLFYGLTGSSNLAMALATTLYSVLIVVSLVWMLKAVIPEGENRRSSILFVLASFVGVFTGIDAVATQQGQLFFVMASFYAVYFVNILLVYGIYLRRLSGMKVSKWILGVAGVFSFATGMQSLRQTAIMVCPLIVVEGCRFIYKLAKKTYDKSDFVTSVMMAYVGLANVIGYCLVTFVMKPAHHIVYGNTAIRKGSDILTGFKIAARELLEVTGVKSFAGMDNYKKCAALGCISVVFAVITICVTARSVWYVVRGKVKDKDGMFHLLMVLLLLGVLGIGALGTVMNVMVRHIYYFLWFPMCALSIYYVATRLKGRRCQIYVGVMTAILVISFTISYGTSLSKVFGEEEKEASVCRVLEDEGIEYLYGNWANVPSIAAYSHDKIIAGSWYEFVLRPVNYLNPLDIYGEENKDTAAYLVLTEEESEVRRVADDKGATLTVIYECDEYKIYRSTEVLIGELSDR